MCLIKSLDCPAVFWGKKKSRKFYDFVSLIKKNFIFKVLEEPSDDTGLSVVSHLIYLFDYLINFIYLNYLSSSSQSQQIDALF